MRKRLLSLLLTVVMVLGMLPVNTFAAEIPEGDPFTAITTDAGDAGTITYMGTVTYTGYSSYENVPYYHVQIPQGATEVYVTHPASEDPFVAAEYNSAYGYHAETEGWTGGGMSFAFEEVGDGYTITLPLTNSATDWATGETTEMSFVEDEEGYVGYAVAVEKNDYAPICFFTFEYAEVEEHICVFDQENTSDDYLCTEADCDNAATYYLSCECGEAGEDTFYYGEAAGHSYTDGTCTNCGGTDPEYVPPKEETQWPFLSIAIDDIELKADRITYKGIFALGDYAEDEQQGVEDSYDYVHEVPYYHVSVPCGTASVDVTYSADTNILNNGTDAYGYRTDLEVDAVSSATVRGTTFRNAYTKNEDGTQTVTTPVTGYTFDADGNGHAITLEEDGGSYAAVCLFSFEYDGKDHIYDSGNVTTAATCTADGVKTFACSCGDSYTEPIDATGHSYANGTCANCGEADPDYVAPGAEIPDGTNIAAITAVTEFADGEAISYYQWDSPAGEAPSYIAAVPEGTQTVAVTFKSGTHPDPYGDDVKKLSGARAFYYYNADTDEYYYNTGSKEATATQNDSGLWSIELNVADFLYKDQNYYGAYDTSYGVQYFLAFQYPEGAHEHNYTEEVTTEPGCVTPGVKTYTCACNDSYTVPIEATGHKYGVPVEVLATCAAQGSKTWTCNNCDKDTVGHTKTEFTDKAEHTYNEGEVTTRATCTEDGVMTFTCSVCKEGVEGHTKTETIAASGHDYQNGKCENCGDICPEQDENGVYQIGTYEELLWFANAVNGGNKAISAVLTADITLGADWPGIGNYTNRFAGSFDGQNHTVTLSGSTFGLFGYTLGTYDGNGNTQVVAVVQNVILDGTVQNSALIQNAGYTHITNCINKADITGGNANVAGIVGTVSGFMKYGQTYSDVLIQNCANEGNINGEKYTAGIVGYSQANTRLNSCSNTGTISGTNYVGGLVGFLQEAKGTCEIKNSYNHGAVTGSSYVGGICGNTYNGVNIENCYNAGQCGYGITANIYNKTVSIINCYYQGTKSDKGVPDNSFTNISATAVTAVELSSDEFAAQLGSAYTQSCPAPVLSWQETQSHTGMEEDGVCDVCGLGGNVKEEYNVTFPTGEGFTVTGEAAAIQGEAYTFTVTVNNGYRKLSTFAVKVNGEIVSESTETEDSYTVENVVGLLSITVEGVEKIPETLTVTLPNGEGKGYRVTPEVAGSTTVAYDGTFRFKVTMHENFQKGSDFQVLVNNSLRITPDENGWYTLSNVQEEKTITVSGVDAKPYQDTASVMLNITLGTDSMYRTPENRGNTRMLFRELEVPYFDLGEYGLSGLYYNPYCYLDKDNNEVIPYAVGDRESAYGNITVIHAFIYATEKFLMADELDEEDIGTGESYRKNPEAFDELIHFPLDPGSTFMSLWDHGSNLNYYVNYTYPLGKPGLGATCDQIVLNDGDSINMHLIGDGQVDENGDYVQGSGGSAGSAFGVFVVNDKDGAFSYTDDIFHNYTVKQGESVDLTLYVSHETGSSEDGGNGAYDTEATVLPDKQLYLTTQNTMTDTITGTDSGWTAMEDMVTDPDGKCTLDTSDLEPGVYYIGTTGGKLAGGFKGRGLELGMTVLKLTVTEGDAGTQEPQRKPGDVDGNGLITADDAAAAFAASKSTAGLTQVQIEAADVDNSGFITADDAAAIFAMSKGGAN